MEVKGFTLFSNLAGFGEVIGYGREIFVVNTHLRFLFGVVCAIDAHLRLFSMR